MDVSSAQRGLVIGGLAAAALTMAVTLGGCGSGAAAQPARSGQAAPSGQAASTQPATLAAAARARAVADAKAKAAQYARALGEPLGPVVSITDQASVQPVLQYGAASAAPGKSVPISPGTQQLSVSITAVFAV